VIWALEYSSVSWLLTVRSPAAAETSAVPLPESAGLGRVSIYHGGPGVAMDVTVEVTRLAWPGLTPGLTWLR
jgi:hypothetical protein